MDIMEILEIIAYLGGWAVLTAGIAIFIGKFFAERIADKLKIKWSGEQEEKLEKLRAEVTLEHSIFTSILNSYSSSHQLSQSNRIKAVQTLWDNVLETRKIGEIPSFFFGILSESEYNMDQSVKLLNSLSFDNSVGKIHQIRENVEKFRPFLGEHLWSLFVIYTILVGRISFLLIEGKKKRDIKSWHKDEHIQSILMEIFDEKERNSIFQKSDSLLSKGSFGDATKLLEQKILFEMLKIISGELAAESDFSNAKKLQELIKQEDIRNNTK
jgi:hypothetical protein